MVTQINLGSIFSSGGKTVLGGSSSGLDTENIITTLVEARKISVTRLEDKVETNTNKAGAYGELRSILTRLQDASDIIRNPPGVANDASNLFRYRTASLASNTSTAAGTYLSVTAEPGKSLGSASVTVTSLAAAKSQMTTLGFASLSASAVEAAGGTTAGKFSAGTITLNALGTNVDIDLEAGDNLSDIVAKINSQASLSGVRATTLKISDTDYRLQLTSTQTGTAYAYSLTDDGSGVLDEVTLSNVSTAANAGITVNGVAITRSSNAIDDVIENVTLNLIDDTPVGTTLTLNLSADTTTITNGITGFVDAYNELKLFLANQTARESDGTAKETAYLTNEGTARSISNRVVNELSTLVGGLAQNFNDLTDIGITFSDFEGDDENAPTRNILAIDTDKLQSALQTNFDDVRKVFEFDFTADSTNLQVFRRTNGHSINNFTVNVNTATETATATYLDGAVTRTVNLDYDDSSGSILLSGEDDSVLDGLQMIYTGTASDSIAVTTTQGFGDRIFNALDTILQEDTGLLDAEVNGLSDRNTQLDKDIERLNARIEEFRQQMLDRFATLESAIGQINTLLASLDAQAQARNNQ